MKINATAQKREIFLNLPLGLRLGANKYVFHTDSTISGWTDSLNRRFVATHSQNNAPQYRTQVYQRNKATQL